MEGYGRYAVHILASRKYGALYIGVTGDLLGRVITHREEWLQGFTSRYHKKWRRAWKIELIEQSNPDWRDLFDEIAG